MSTEEMMTTLSEAEKAAALRFCETCDDDEGYDVSNAMMRRLAELGLVVHLGGGYYEQQEALLELRDALDEWHEASYQRGVLAAGEAIARGNLDPLAHTSTGNPGYDDGFFTKLSEARCAQAVRVG